jgi:hypothetical protein
MTTSVLEDSTWREGEVEKKIDGKEVGVDGRVRVYLP